MQWAADFFIGEARKSQHAFPSAAVEEGLLIYNYRPMGNSSKQAYVFGPAARRQFIASDTPQARLVNMM